MLWVAQAPPQVFFRFLIRALFYCSVLPLCFAFNPNALLCARCLFELPSHLYSFFGQTFVQSSGLGLPRPSCCHLAIFAWILGCLLGSLGPSLGPWVFGCSWALCACRLGLGMCSSCPIQGSPSYNRLWPTLGRSMCSSLGAAAHRPAQRAAPSQVTPQHQAPQSTAPAQRGLLFSA